MVERSKVLNNWLVLGILLLIITDVAASLKWTGLFLTLFVMGCIFYLTGLYVSWFNTRGFKKLGKKKSS